MKFLLLLLLLCTNVVYAKCNLTFKTLDQNKINLDKGECSNYDLYGNSTSARIPFITEQINIQKLMGQTIKRDNYNSENGVLTSSFWDKNDVYGLAHLYVATDVQNENTLMIVTDYDDNVKIVGDKNKKLFGSILKASDFPLKLLHNPKIKSALELFFND